MFPHHNQHPTNFQTSIFTRRNPPPLIKPPNGYDNIGSPLKAAYHLEHSPRQNLSPLRQPNSKLNNNRRSRSPILFSKRDCFSPNNAQLSPLRKRQVFQPQENLSNQKQLSFTNLIRKNSNAGNLEYQNTGNFNRTMEHSKQNYLQSDRNFREDTNLFKKLANLIKSNKPNQSSFLNSGISDNSVKFKGAPQSCKNQQSSNKKMFIKNVPTVQSIQSPEQRDFNGYYENLENIDTRCYQEYERMTSECENRERKQSYDCSKERSDPKMQKKDSKKSSGHEEEFQSLSFKKINLDKSPTQPSQNLPSTIDYHLTSSFGTATLKNQIIGQPEPCTKPMVNPFDQITDFQQIEAMESIKCSVNESNDSMFASLKMLLSKVNGHKVEEKVVEREHESINVSIGQDSESSELDMEPYLVKRR